jgi:hypothetical protein
MKVRKTLKITSRTSSVTNGFVQAIIPCFLPTDEESATALAVLGVDPDNPTCVYCGAPATDWDHLRPLVKGKRPTGYFTGVQNLVPACGPCNQSKGGQEWRIWIKGSANGCPKARGIADLQLRIAALEAFEAWSAHDRIAMRELVGAEVWDDYWARLQAIEDLMHAAQREAIFIRGKIAAALSKNVTEPGTKPAP